MHWVAISEKDLANESLEQRLWDVTDQFGANSGLQDYTGATPGQRS